MGDRAESLLKPLKAGTKDYLNKTIVPELIESLTKLAIARPEEPHLWLAHFMLEKSPLSDLYAIKRVDPRAGEERPSYRQLYLSSDEKFATPISASTKLKTGLEAGASSYAGAAAASSAAAGYEGKSSNQEEEKEAYDDRMRVGVRVDKKHFLVSLKQSSSSNNGDAVFSLQAKALGSNDNVQRDVTIDELGEEELSLLRRDAKTTMDKVVYAAKKASLMQKLVSIISKEL